MKEGDILARKKTQLSLTKLAALACPPSNQTEEAVGRVEQEMCLVAAQEQLPTQVILIQSLSIQDIYIQFTG